jgi:hypothetical protein
MPAPHVSNTCAGPIVHFVLRISNEHSRSGRTRQERVCNPQITGFELPRSVAPTHPPIGTGRITAQPSITFYQHLGLRNGLRCERRPYMAEVAHLVVSDGLTTLYWSAL